MKKPQSITGRDAYIMSQALVIAIGHIQRLPQKQQEWSNMVDMCQIARTLFPGFLEIHAVSFFRSMDFLINMFPEKNADQKQKEKFDKTTRDLIKQFETY